MPEKPGSFDFYLTDVSPRDKPWDSHRAESQQVEHLYKMTDYHRYAERIRLCSNWLGFKFTTSEQGEIKFKLSDAQFCRVRHCPVCQWRRTLMWCARFFQAIPKVMEAHPKARWVFLTLTVRNCPLEELRAAVKEMNAGWKRLSERKEFPAIGWIKSLEVTRGEDDQAHPHFHVLMMVRSSYFTHGYVKHARWVELWQQCMRLDYAPSVHVRRVDYGEKHIDIANLTDEVVRTDMVHEQVIPGAIKGLLVGLLETLKYTVKPADLLRSADPVWLDGITQQLHKTRAIAVGGLLKDYLSEEEPTDEELIQGIDPVEEAFRADPEAWFGWREMEQRYRAIDRDKIKDTQMLINRTPEVLSK